MATTSLPLRWALWPTRATINLGNDDPDLVGASGGMGTEDRGRALVGRTGPIYSALDFDNI
jgi:hypothetical protein